MNKEASTTLENNELDSTKGEIEVRVDAERELDPAEEFSTAVTRESEDTRAEMLQRLFNSFPSASANAKAGLEEYFENAQNRRQAHSPLLAKTASESAPQTLNDKVRDVLGEK